MWEGEEKNSLARASEGGGFIGGSLDVVPSLRGILAVLNVGVAHRLF